MRSTKDDAALAHLRVLVHEHGVDELLDVTHDRAKAEIAASQTTRHVTSRWVRRRRRRRKF